MVTIKDGCGCDPCDCDWKQKLKEAYARASVSVNKVGDYDGAIYYPDGTGFVKIPIPRLSEVQQITTNKEDIAELKAQDVQLQANITAEENARKAKDDNLDSDISRIDATDARQTELIQDNADRINSTYNDLVVTEATVATHNSEIITLKANNETLAKSLVSDVIMTDGTTAGSVQVSIEREDGSLITSANYRWGKDIGIRLEAGTQAGYVKAVISLSDGTELVSNEYKIVEVLESDVYVTAITLIADQAAGTLGGNISYSNGTTQTINSVSVPTAPGVTSAIETLQSRMAALEQKNATQDASITAIDGRVQALENTPGIGQFANGRLGTIAGSTTDGRIKAEDDGTGSVNGWSDLKGRVTTAEGQIVTAQNDITAIKTKNTQQDTAINGLQTSKVNVAQGVANAGKALVVGSDGNVAPGVVSGGEVWEEIDFSNFPRDWVDGDRVKVVLKVKEKIATIPSKWTTVPTTIDFEVAENALQPVFEFTIGANAEGKKSIFIITKIDIDKYIAGICFNSPQSASKLNNPTPYMTYFYVGAFIFNGGGGKRQESAIGTITNAGEYISKMWRLKR